MTDIHIPPEAVEAGARAIFKVKNPDLEWENCAAEIGSAYAQAQRNQARACFLAMIEAWPGMAHYRGGWEPVIHNNRKPHLILPLTETPDGE